MTKQSLLNDMAKQISNSVANNASDPFGFGLPWGTYDSISHGAGLAVMAAEYNYLKRNQQLRRRLAALAREYFRRERLGSDFHRRQRRYVSRLHAASGGKHRWID